MGHDQVSALSHNLPAPPSLRVLFNLRAPFVKVNETGNTTITDTINSAVIGAGGISQTDLDNAIVPLITKAGAHDVATQTNVDSTAVLNTKQLQNFNNINAINTDLTTNYQTNAQVATNF